MQTNASLQPARRRGVISVAISSAWPCPSFLVVRLVAWPPAALLYCNTRRALPAVVARRVPGHSVSGIRRVTPPLTRAHISLS